MPASRAPGTSDRSNVQVIAQSFCRLDGRSRRRVSERDQNRFELAQKISELRIAGARGGERIEPIRFDERRGEIAIAVEQRRRCRCCSRSAARLRLREDARPHTHRARARQRYRLTIRPGGAGGALLRPGIEANPDRERERACASKSERAVAVIHACNACRRSRHDSRASARRAYRGAVRDCRHRRALKSASGTGAGIASLRASACSIAA